MDRRVVITGIGMVTPLGAGKEAFALALWQGETGIGEVAAFPTRGSPRIWGPRSAHLRPAISSR